MNDPYRTPLRLTPDLIAEYAEWTARNRAAARAYRERPNACTRAIWKRSW